MAAVQVRCIASDVDAALSFHCQHLGFGEVRQQDLRLVPSLPGGQDLGGAARVKALASR